MTIPMISNRIVAKSCLLLCFALSGLVRGQGEISGKVVRITDGDTITVLDSSKTQIKVRLAGIDAPEKAQAFGQKSRQNLSSLVYGKTVTLVGNKTDRWGRKVAKVLVDGVDAGVQQIKDGLAWHFKRYEREQTNEDRKLYADAEIAARRSSTGLWSDKDPLPPWDFRAR